MTDTVRVVQVSDSHFSAAAGQPRERTELVTWLRDDPPDLVVHTGDIVYADPDDAADRRFARSLLDGVPVPFAVIPGNHDVGFYDEPSLLPARLERFTASWGHDRFSIDLGAWRLVGANAYAFGRDDEIGRDHATWLHDAVTTDRPCAVFVHQTPYDDCPDEWGMPVGAAVAFRAAVDPARPAFVSSGHRHCAARRRVDGVETVWAPSLRLVGEDSPTWLRSVGASGVDASPGVLDIRLGAKAEFDLSIRRS